MATHYTGACKSFSQKILQEYAWSSSQSSYASIFRNLDWEIPYRIGKQRVKGMEFEDYELGYKGINYAYVIAWKTKQPSEVP
jgi:hypothetical protein